ncbi:Corticotropin-releasing factor receptor 2 [Toxocara canis]|uniref:Corticotropin-releasing factor receptor 2 n=2 Tax=Toxocara canis TaxID=6265 RepID=A0A0B2UVA0_TOXCA|nr:Corticotropin-releasing factor receptor 2 [Toxocara canis]
MSGGVIGRERATCVELINHGAAFSHNASSGCAANFDRSLCWQSAAIGEVAERKCPFTYCLNVAGCGRIASDFNVQRLCQTNGTWADPIYAQCIDVIKYHPQCIVGFCRTCPDLLREMVISVSLTLSIISVALLVSALVLFTIFDSIQCRRLSIHKNLAAAFVFRFAVLAVWTVVQTSNVFQDCSSYNPVPLFQYEWVCKLLLWLVIYFQVASVMWMLIEGGYLYSRFTVFAMRHTEAPYYAYLLCGWGVPFVVVLSWTVVHQQRSSQNQNSFCWLPYAQGHHLWILAGAMGLALTLNLLFLLGIVVILVQKLRAENTAESRKIWRTIKATLLLVPLLGVSNIPLFYEPPEPSSAYMLGSAILQHSQGIFIAVLYCFLNSEVQNAVKRQFSKVTSHLFRQRERFETERTYIPEAGNHKSRRLGVPMEELNGMDNERQKQVNGTRQLEHSIE